MTSNIKLIAGIAMFIFAAFYITACQDNVSSNFDDSIQPLTELSLIPETTNTSIKVKQGSAHGLDSYFAFDLSNIQSNSIVRDGVTEAWCVEWNKPIRYDGIDYKDIEMYSTYGSEKWKPVNYLMNIRNELKSEDPELTYREFQVAIWSLIDNPGFDMDGLLKNGEMPSRLMHNGNPNFNVTKVKKILDKVWSESKDFKYNKTSKFLAITNKGSKEQNGGIPVEKCRGETAWADGDRYVEPGNWATYTEYVPNTTVTLFAGQTHEAGEVHMSEADQDGNVTITITLNDGWELDPYDEDGDGNPIPNEEGVKIQGYDIEPPASNPAPGLFTTYKGNDLTIVVPEFKYYGIHLDLIECIDDHDVEPVL